MTMTPDLVRRSLISRGVRVADGALDTEIRSLEDLVDVRIDSNIADYMREFDGFIDDDFDGPSFISVWPIEKIRSRVDRSILPYVGFADMGFYAVVYYVRLADASLEITDNSEEVVAKNYQEFWDYILSFK